jgi:hypothetical protein
MLKSKRGAGKCLQGESAQTKEAFLAHIRECIRSALQELDFEREPYFKNWDQNFRDKVSPALGSSSLRSIGDELRGKWREQAPSPLDFCVDVVMNELQHVVEQSPSDEQIAQASAESNLEFIEPPAGKFLFVPHQLDRAIDNIAYHIQMRCPVGRNSDPRKYYSDIADEFWRKMQPVIMPIIDAYKGDHPLSYDRLFDQCWVLDSDDSESDDGYCSNSDAADDVGADSAVADAPPAAVGAGRSRNTLLAAPAAGAASDADAADVPAEAVPDGSFDL